ncbi:hypothetical protein RRG08_067318 [Elysia crispata]|uniref:Uncharacterized protein n=1 Tax=Elysia crispata TaxID=231223 RepID=A0AAE0YD95_9GAST|nr:hypothetical protein RRG08_067318 [Elysia crispata]
MVTLLSLIDPSTDTQLADMERGELSLSECIPNKGPHPRTYMYEDSWEFFLDDHVHGEGITPPQPPPPTESVVLRRRHDHHQQQQRPAGQEQHHHQQQRHNSANGAIFADGFILHTALYSAPSIPSSSVPVLTSKLTYTSVPSTVPAMIFVEIYYYLVDDFGLSADMGVMHRDAQEEDHTGTTITYTAKISGQDNVHLMSVRVPQIIKFDSEVTTISIDMTDELVVVIKGENFYVRTTQGMSAISRRPCMINNEFTDDDINQLKMLFFMLGNTPQPTKPVYRKYNPVLRERSNLYSQWP